MKAIIHVVRAQAARARRATLAARARHCPCAPGVYRLYRGRCLVHVGMAAGGATLRSEVLAHARGDYGERTRRADRVVWEVARDALFAYHRFLSLYAAATYDAASGSRRADAPTGSRRLGPAPRRSADRAPLKARVTRAPL